MLSTDPDGAERFRARRRRTAPLADEWAAFGWGTRDVDGHDHGRLLTSLRPSTTGRPVAVAVRTVEGKGVSVVEDRAEWHHGVPDAAQVRAALEEVAS